MRFASAVFLMFAVLFASSANAALEIVRVWPSYRAAGTFERISEYFGRAIPGEEIIRRTQPATRSGFYFLTRVKNSDADAISATVELHVITPVSAVPVVRTFAAEIPPGRSLVNVGLTGSDWPGAEVHPVAWLLVIRGADGSELTREQSFLWAQPAEATATK